MLDYSEIGKRIAKRRKELHLTQAEVAERTDIGDKYLSNIERAVSIPSTEVIMRLAFALDTTPDEFLVGISSDSRNESWKNVADLLRGLNEKQLSLAQSFLRWLRDEKW